MGAFGIKILGYNSIGVSPVFGEKPDRAIWSLPDITHALRFRELDALDFPKIPHRIYSRNEVRIQRPDEELSLPLRPQPSRVDRESGRCDRRVPVELGLLQPLPGCAFTYLLAGVMDTVGNDGPSIIETPLNQIDFIAAACTVFARPQPAIPVKGCALGISMAIRPDFGTSIGLADKRIV